MDYAGISIVLSVFYVILFTSFTTYVAYQKGYSWVSWFILGLLFGIIALLVTLGLPKKVKQEQTTLVNNDPNDISNFI
jgi:hypothetical protein